MFLYKLTLQIMKLYRRMYTNKRESCVVSLYLRGEMVHHALHIMYPIIIVSIANFSILLHNIFLILEVPNCPSYDKKKQKEPSRAQHEPNPLKVDLAQLKIWYVNFSVTKFSPIFNMKCHNIKYFNTKSTYN